MDEVRHAQAILEVAHSGVVAMDERGCIAYWNARAEEIFGQSRSEVMGRFLADTIIPERYRESHWQGLRRFLTSGTGAALNRRHLKLDALRRDGSEFSIELSLTAVAGD